MIPFKSNMADFLTTIYDDKDFRKYRSKKIRRYDINEESDLFAPGTITVIVSYGNSTEGSIKLNKIINDPVNFGNKVFKEIDELINFRIDLNFDKINQNELRQKLMENPILAEIKHCGKTLISSLPINKEHGLSIVSFPYNGGELDDIELVEHFYSSTNNELEAVAFVRKPNVSEIEAKALSKVPPATRYVNVSESPIQTCNTPVAATVAVTVAVVVVTAERTIAGGCSNIINYLNHGLLTEKQIDELGPELTAIELTRLRRKIMLGL